MLNKVVIKKTMNPEDGYEDESRLFKDTVQHKKDVEQVMDIIGEYIKERGRGHDWTKLAYFDDFARDCLERKDTPDFKSRDWYHIHTLKERHHVNARVPDNVNFIDLLELMVDCIVAGYARSGKINYNFMVVSQTIINEAYWNTIRLIEDSIILDNYE